MKKIILGMIFVFATITFLNARGGIGDPKINEKYFKSFDNISCDEQALATGYSAHLAGMDDDEIFFYMNVSYALCMGYEYGDIRM